MQTAFKDDRKRTFLNAESADKPLVSPVPQATLDAARAYRLSRLRAQLVRRDCAAILLFDPVNIRYGFDYSNMQVWTAHNPIRYALKFADGTGVRGGTSVDLPTLGTRRDRNRALGASAF